MEIEEKRREERWCYSSEYKLPHNTSHALCGALRPLTVPLLLRGLRGAESTVSKIREDRKSEEENQTNSRNAKRRVKRGSESVSECEYCLTYCGAS